MKTEMMTEMIPYKVKDMNLADFGRKEIEIAEKEMPGLMAIRRKYAAQKPLKGARVSGSLHMTIQIQWWQLGGPTAARIVLSVLACIVAASILTATTPVQRLLDGVASLAQPFRRFGADPERFALTIAIMLRSIPFIAALTVTSAIPPGPAAWSATPGP